MHEFVRLCRGRIDSVLVLSGGRRREARSRDRMPMLSIGRRGENDRVDQVRVVPVLTVAQGRSHSTTQRPA